MPTIALLLVESNMVKSYVYDGVPPVASALKVTVWPTLRVAGRVGIEDIETACALTACDRNTEKKITERIRPNDCLCDTFITNMYFGVSLI